MHRAVLLLVLFEFLRGRVDILRAIQFVDVFFKFSAVDYSRHSRAPKTGDDRRGQMRYFSENLESVALARSRCIVIFDCVKRAIASVSSSFASVARPDAASSRARTPLAAPSKGRASSLKAIPATRCRHSKASSVLAVPCKARMPASANTAKASTPPYPFCLAPAWQARTRDNPRRTSPS